MTTETHERADAGASYLRFRRQAQMVKATLERARDAFEALDMRSDATIISTLAEQLVGEAFKVLVIGEFKRGKSTFINALLGAEVLPAYATPCTAVINEVKHADQPRALLHFKPELPSPLPDGLPDTVHAHLKRQGPRVSMDIPVTELERYVVIRDPARDQAESVAETPYALVELFWPLALLRNGVEIIDSPGLNEHETRNDITINYLGKADAIIFVMSCHALASQSEMRSVQEIRDYGHKELFFVANRFDEIRKKERERTREYALSKLADQTDRGERGIFFLSSLDALEGRIDDEPHRLAASGMLELERELERFLTNDRGRIKLLRPAQRCIALVREAAHKVIPGQRRMLDESVEELDRRYEKVKPLLENAERRREQVRVMLDGSRRDAAHEARQLTERQIRSMTERVSVWADDLELENKYSVLKLSSNAQIEKLSKEVSEKLSERFESELRDWVKEILHPRVEHALELGLRKAEADARALLKNLDDAYSTMTGMRLGADDVGGEAVGTWERVLAGAAGLVLVSPGSALVGATLGAREMLGSILPQVALAVVLGVIGFTNPLLWIPLLLGAGGLQAFLGQEKVTKKTVQKVVEGFRRTLREKTAEVALSVEKSLLEKTEVLQAAVLSGLDHEIQSTREQVEVVLAEKRRGIQEAKARRDRLDAVGHQLSQVAEELEQVVAQYL